MFFCSKKHRNVYVCLHYYCLPASSVIVVLTKSPAKIGTALKYIWTLHSWQKENAHFHIRNMYGVKLYCFMNNSGRFPAPWMIIILKRRKISKKNLRELHKKRIICWINNIGTAQLFLILGQLLGTKYWNLDQDQMSMCPVVLPKNMIKKKKKKTRASRMQKLLYSTVWCFRNQNWA